MGAVSHRFETLDTPITELKLLQRKPIRDSRGYLERMYCAEELRTLLPPSQPIVQINRTLTEQRGTVRGMHFQYPPHAEVKIVSCLRGEVFDVAVDLRQDSATFLKWHAETLSADNYRMLLIPAGFAHGFQTLVDHCELLYFHTALYCPSAEGGLNAQDPALGIRWPVEITDRSPRDAGRPFITKEFTGMHV